MQYNLDQYLGNEDYIEKYDTITNKTGSVAIHNMIKKFGRGKKLTYDEIKELIISLIKNENLPQLQRSVQIYSYQVKPELRKKLYKPENSIRPQNKLIKPLFKPAKSLEPNVEEPVKRNLKMDDDKCKRITM